MSSSSAILAFQLGDRVLVEGPSSSDDNSNFERSGIIKYIGKTEFKEGDWLGIELDSPTGKNDGSVAGVRYFTCEPFHGLFVPPNKARLNLSGDSKFGDTMFSVTPSSKKQNNFTSSFMNSSNIGTPNHLDRIENLQMDFSAVKDISDSFGIGSDHVGLKTPTANVKTQTVTPATNDLKNAQNDIIRLRDQILAIKSDLSKNGTTSTSDNQESVNSIVNKLSSMLETYEQVSVQYENQLKHFLMARKASKLDSIPNSELENLRSEYEKARNDFYNEIKENDSLKERISELEGIISKNNKTIAQQDEEIQRNHYEAARSRTEHEIETVLEEEHRKRMISHENDLKIMKSRFDDELRQKKMVISDLQNEVAFLKQSEKVLEEELNSRRYRLDHQNLSDEKKELQRLSDDLFSAKRQVEEFKKLLDESHTAKSKSDEYYRNEIDRLRNEFREDNNQYNELKQDLKELSNRLKQTRSDNEELTWALESSRKENERLNGLIEDQAQKLTEREKKLQAFSERIRELEDKGLQSHEIEGLQNEIKKLNIELGEERTKFIAPMEQLAVFKRKVTLIEREKELLEEQLRLSRLSAVSQGEFQTFSTFIQGLKRHIEAEILGIEPLKLTLHDVVRAKEMVDILLKVTDDVRVKVFNHLSQVEQVIKARIIQPESRLAESSSNGDISAAETVKVEKGVRTYDLDSLSDLRRKIDFRNERTEFTEPSRTLREPLGVTSIPNTSTYLSYSSNNNNNNNNNNRFSKSSNSLDNDLENRMNNFRNLVSDLRTRSGGMVSSGNVNTRPSHYSHHQYSQPSSTLVRAHEPIRCNLCQEYGHDALSCPDYLSGNETFSEDLFLKDVRNSKFNSRFSERTRV